MIRYRRVALNALLTLILITAPSSFMHVASAAPSFPPLPDFGKRVNYVDWYEKVARTDDKDNAYSLYAEFMPGLIDSDVKDADWPEFAGMMTTPVSQNEMAQFSEENRDRARPIMPWFPARRGAWEQSYDRTRGVLRKFDAATKKKYVVAPPSIDGDKDDNANRFSNFTLAHVSKIRQCALGTLEAAWRINKKGGVNAGRFMAAIESNLRAASQFQKALFSTEALTGFSIRRTTYLNLRWAFAHGILKEADSDKIAALLRKIDKTPMDASPCLGTEAAMMLDNLQYIYGPLGGGGGEGGGLKLNGNRYRDVTGQAMGGGNRFGLGARIETDPQGTAAAILTAHKQMAPLMGPGFKNSNNQSLYDIARALAQKNNLTKGMYYSLEGTYAAIYQAAAKAEAERRATQLLLEIFGYKVKHKAWPKKLAQLDKKRVAGILKDPFSNKPFIYLVLNDKPVLYSVGPDGQDDGGSHDDSWAPDTDFVVWPIPNSEETLAASRLNRIPIDKLTSFENINEKFKGRRVTVSAEVRSVSSRPSKKHGERFSVMLNQGKTELKLFYYADVAGALSDHQKLVEGRKIRVTATVVSEDGKWRLQLKEPRDLAYEE